MTKGTKRDRLLFSAYLPILGSEREANAAAIGKRTEPRSGPVLYAQSRHPLELFFVVSN